MNTFSLRWIFVAIASTALAVTAILNANELWLAATGFLFLGLLGLSAIYVVFRGRSAPFAVGFAVFAGLAYWLEPSLDLDYFSEGVANVSKESAVLRVCLALACGCVGGMICRHVASDVTPRRVGLAMWLAIIALFAAAAIAAGVVKVDRLVAEANANQPPGGSPYGGYGSMGGYGRPSAGYGRPGGGAGYGRPGGGAGYGRPGGGTGYGPPSQP